MSRRKGVYFSFDKVGGIEKLIAEKPIAARIFLGSSAFLVGMEFSNHKG
jgi:hypothetical protein